MNRHLLRALLFGIEVAALSWLPLACLYYFGHSQLGWVLVYFVALAILLTRSRRGGGE